MYAWFTFPTGATVISSSSEYATSFGTELLPLVYLGVGIVAAVVLVKYLRRRVSKGIGHVGKR